MVRQVPQQWIWLDSAKVLIFLRAKIAVVIMIHSDHVTERIQQVLLLLLYRSTFNLLYVLLSKYKNIDNNHHAVRNIGGESTR
jgi:hypothetical protein